MGVRQVKKDGDEALMIRKRRAMFASPPTCVYLCSYKNEFGEGSGENASLASQSVSLCAQKSSFREWVCLVL